MFAFELLSYRPPLLAGTLALMFLRSLLDGISILMLIPLLSTAGIVSGQVIGDQDHLFRILDRAMGGAPTLGAVLIVWFVLMVVRSAVGCAVTILSARLMTGYVDHIRCRLCDSLCSASWIHLASTRQAHDTHALTMQAESVESAARYTVGVVGTLFTILGGLAVAFLVSPRLTLAIGAAALLLTLPLLVFTRLAFRRGAEAMVAMQALYDLLVERMSSIKLAKAFGIERQLTEEFGRLSQQYRRSVIAVRANGAYATSMHDIAAAALMVAFVYLAVQVLGASSLEIIVLVVVFSRILPPVISFQSALRSLAAIIPDYVAMREAEARARTHHEDEPRNRIDLPLDVSITLSGVGFRYPGVQAPEILSDVTLELPAHSAIGLVGLSGAGKSTLADIVVGLVAPSAGNLSVDHRRIDEDMRRQWRSNVTYVPQDAPLFHDTLRANLTMGGAEVTEKEIWECLEMVRAADLVRGLPSGLDTQAGDRGVRFSGGERQRLRLASALLRKPKLLVLDESTSALNPLDEVEIVHALKQMLHRMTIIMIAHRFSSVSWTDKVVVLEKGRVAAFGAPSDVLGEWSRHLSGQLIAVPPPGSPV